MRDCVLSMKRCPSEVESSSTVALEWRLKRCKAVDRLSELPDDILVFILSRLKLKEAARTSILSQRWRNLWTFTTGALNFHYEDPVPDGDEAFSLYYEAAEDTNAMGKGKLLLVEMPEFTDWVNHILSLHQGSTIDEFQVSAKLFGRIRKNIVDKWVEFALAKRVKRLKLDFTGKIRSREANYSFTKPLIRKFSSHLDSLTILSLNKVAVSSKVIRYLMRKCCFLEELHVEQSSCLVEMKVPGPLPHLRCLRIVGCFKLKSIEIRAINIVVFAYHGYDIPVTFRKSPVLVEASLGGWYASYFVENISQFSSYISRVESLVLDFGSFRYLRDQVLPELPTFNYLRNLKLMLNGFGENTLDCCVSFLKKSPILRRFSLEVSPYKVPEHANWRRIERSSKCLHSLVNVLELEGFKGTEGIAEIYCSIVSCLPSLEQVILRPTYLRFCDNVEIKEKVADLSNHLKMIMPPKAELKLLFVVFPS